MPNRRELMLSKVGLAVGLLVPTASAEAQGAQQVADSDSVYAPAKHLIADIDRIVTPNGVQELQTVRLGGIDQWISIRGADRSNPILLFVHGGPGAPEMGAAWAFQRSWEDYFTIVNWDQRGAGKTLRTNGASAFAGNLTRERMTQDAVELMGWLRERFHQDKITVVGHSWGNVVGLGAALARPDWAAAYVGIGPLLDMQANERLSYQQVLTIAQQRNDTQALAELQSIAPYPGAGLTLERIGVERKWVALYGGLAAGRDNANFYFHAPRISPVYDAADRAAIDAGGELSIPALLADMGAVDFTPVRRVSFPVVMFVGRHDMTTPHVIAERWIDALDAPSKQLVWFENSAHLSPIEEPGRTLVALVNCVLPLVRRD
jgi:pimeloyl-ACP methyl ester carboxylesterase